MKGGFSLEKQLCLWTVDLQNIEICERALLSLLYRVQYTDKSCVSQPEPLLHQWSVVHSSVFTVRIAASTTMAYFGFQDSGRQKHKVWLEKGPISGLIYVFCRSSWTANVFTDPTTMFFKKHFYHRSRF